MEKIEETLKKLRDPRTIYESEEKFKSDIKNLTYGLLNKEDLIDEVKDIEFEDYCFTGDENDNVFEYSPIDKTFVVNLAILSAKFKKVNDLSSVQDIENAYKYNALVLLKEILAGVNRVSVDTIKKYNCSDLELYHIKQLECEYLMDIKLNGLDKFNVKKLNSVPKLNEYKLNYNDVSRPTERYIKVKSYFDTIDIYDKYISEKLPFELFYLSNQSDLIEGYFRKKRLTYPLELYFSFIETVEGRNYLSDFKWFEKEYMNTLSNVSKKFSLKQRLIYGMPIDDPCEYQQLIRNKLK